MASTGKSALGGAATGASLGSTIPGIGTAIGAAVGAAVGTVASLFKSKKHYHVYFWNGSAWQFVQDGNPSQIKPTVANLRSQGLPVAVVRNKGGKNPAGSLAPKDPPAGASSSPASAGSGTGSKLPWILAGIAGLGVLGALLIKKRR